jgi:hypothetical protein
VFHDGGWGTVCASDNLFGPYDYEPEFGAARDFNASAAAAACRQMGYKAGFRPKLEYIKDLKSAVSIQRVPVWLAGAQCGPDAQKLAGGDCKLGSWGNTTGCGHSSDVMLLCSRGASPGALTVEIKRNLSIVSVVLCGSAYFAYGRKQNTTLNSLLVLPNHILMLNITS